MLPFFLLIKYRTDINKPIDKTDSTPVNFSIEKGQTAKTIGENLEEQGIIRSSRSFYIYVRRNEPDTPFLSGLFSLNKGMTVPEIIETLTSPSKANLRITIREGLMIRDIDKILVEKGLISEGEFKTAVKNFNDWDKYDFLDREILSKLTLPLEGYIYPDTYFLNPINFSPEDLIEKTLYNFGKKFSTVKNQITDKSYHEIVTMASIIETEVFGTEDRKIVSGILWKRLQNNWRLDADATLLYIKTDRNITPQDLQSTSPYNTRRQHGLPPGPVSNPSIESIEAAINPKKSDYWFYLNRQDTFETIFAKTNEEHNLNRARYL